MATKIIETVEWNVGCLAYRAKRFLFGDAKPQCAAEAATALFVFVVGFLMTALLFA